MALSWESPSLWPSGIGSRLRRNRLWVWFLAVSDIYPMFIEPTITWVPSEFSGYIWLDTKIVLKKKVYSGTSHHIALPERVNICFTRYSCWNKKSLHQIFSANEQKQFGQKFDIVWWIGNLVLPFQLREKIESRFHAFQCTQWNNSFAKKFQSLEITRAQLVMNSDKIFIVPWCWRINF